MNARTAMLIAEAGRQLQDRLGANPNSEQRCVTAVARWVLLNGPFFYNGEMIDPVAKSIGAGVYAVTHKKGG